MERDTPGFENRSFELSANLDMPAARQYRTEHVDTKPRGWKVRTSLSGAHVLRIGYPPGRRRRGAGRLLEVLHPKAEKSNPRCQMSEWAAKAKSNPEELLIFGLGNPAPREQLRERLKAAQARFDAISQKQSELRRRLKKEHGEKFILTPEWAAIEPESDAAYRELESAKRAMNTGRKKNAVRMTIEQDPSRKQFRASMPHPRGGSWLYAWGHTKKQAAAALRDEWRKARGGNPRHKTIPQLLDDCDRLRAALRRRMNAQAGWAVIQKGKDLAHSSFVSWPKKEQAKKSLAEVQAYYPDLKFKIVRVKGNPSEKEREAAARAAKVIETQGYQGFLDFLARNLGKHEEKQKARRARRHNPISESEQAVKLFEIFHGEDPSKITEKHVSAAMRKDYTALGKLVAVGMDDGGYGEREIAQKWDKCSHINFSDDHVTLASSPDGRQLYAIGGNQNLNGCLDQFEGIDPEKDFIDLGELAFVVYEARKIHDDFEPVEYVHKFGGNGRTRPGWFYDRLKKAIFFIGGEYFIDIDAKISPGIEG